ncbi:MAG: hypothetical protein HZA50_13125 [Planctomycetes bacterium]|nr:hypothetical protein [Planctomycetota bacterium]
MFNDDFSPGFASSAFAKASADCALPGATFCRIFDAENMFSSAVARVDVFVVRHSGFADSSRRSKVKPEGPQHNFNRPLTVCLAGRFFSYNYRHERQKNHPDIVDRDRTKAVAIPMPPRPASCSGFTERERQDGLVGRSIGKYPTIFWG